MPTSATRPPSVPWNDLEEGHFIDLDQVRQGLGSVAPRVDVLPLIQVDSTNQRLLEWDTVPSGFCLVAQSQTAGRGRQGRSWHSDALGSLTFSLKWAISRPPSQWSGLALAVSLAVIRAFTLRGMAQGIGVKWPNDILRHGKKLGGVLVETAHSPLRDDLAVIGIGLNLQPSLPTASNISQPISTLSDQGISLPERSLLLGTLLHELVRMLDEFSRDGFAPLITEWHEHCVHLHHPIELHFPAQPTIQGICAGLTPQGALIVKTSAGEQVFHGGEISLRMESV
ncbi:MAG: biotin--[acetyl-CoA-carboxylase] ligase [Ferrovum sp.]|nr:biotin--[acetyl-CoA-carboxylase] ligase [Ferrovum sp.]NDU86761.1 biotin--[acetyl-CoA-carboxylase] ligase [Ferrovum sp.]